MFKQWRRVSSGIIPVKHNIKALFLALMTGLRRQSGKLLITLTGTIPMLALVACGVASTPVMAPYPGPKLAPGEIINLEMYLAGGYDNRVKAGEKATLFVEIRNTGNKTVNNIRLSSIKPEGWVIDFQPGTIDSLSPENFQTIEVTVIPADNASEGSYTVTLKADANEISKVMEVWLTLEPPKGYWMWVGGIIALVVVAGFIIVYLRVGRK